MSQHCIRFLILVIFASSLTGTASTQAQTGNNDQRPRIQAISTAAWSAGQHANVVSTTEGLKTSASSGTAQTRVTAAPAPFTYFMLRWEATIPDGAAIELQAHTSNDGATWTDWGEIGTNEDLLSITDSPTLH